MGLATHYLLPAGVYLARLCRVSGHKSQTELVGGCGSGALLSCGRNDFGQLGTGDVQDRVAKPVVVRIPAVEAEATSSEATSSAARRIVGVACGDSHSVSGIFKKCTPSRRTAE